MGEMDLVETPSHVADYMRRHDIHQLLTGLVALVVKKLPDDPVSLMIDHLQSIKQKARDNSLRPAGANYTRARRANVCAESGTEELDNWDPPQVEKSEDDAEFLFNALSEGVLFSSLQEEELGLVVKAMVPKEFEEGTTVINQGDDGDHYYVLETGQCDCYLSRTDEDHQRLHVMTYLPGMAFGELALLYNAPRAATIVATKPSKCWALDRLTFKKVLVETSKKERDSKMLFVEKVDLFENLSRFERLRLLEALELEAFEEGERIIQEGDPGNDLFIIESGECRCVVKQQNGEEVECFTCLKKGDYFGELALLTKQPRAASVDAATDVKVYRLQAAAFERLLGPLEAVLRRNSDKYALFLEKNSRSPVNHRLLEHIAVAQGRPLPRLASTTDSERDGVDESERGSPVSAVSPIPPYTQSRRANVYSQSAEEELRDFVPPCIQKSESDRSLISSVISKNVLMRHLDSDEMAVIIDAMEERRYPKSEQIITQGHDGEHYFILEQGTCECYVLPEGGQERKHVMTYHGGDAFGELALMYNAPRAATIEASTDCRCWALDRKTFKKVLMSQGERKRAQQLDILERFALFDNMARFEKLKILSALTTLEVEAASRVISEGDDADAFYMIADGEFRVLRKQSDGTESEVYRRLQSLDYFGEVALLRHGPRTATVEAVSRGKLFVLSAADFARLLGPLEDILRRNIDSYSVWGMAHSNV